MYNEFFGINDTPFSIAPNPRYLYMSHQHHEALAHLLYGIESDGGFITLTGEVGTGKTTVCRCFLEQIPADTNVAFILNPKLTVTELLATICDELQVEFTKGQESAKEYVDAINEYLLLTHAEGRKTLLIIDEAQNLSIDVLEQIRLLTNLETNQRKLLQIILVGQPELRDLFAKPELRQLAQRITARYHLEKLTLNEAIAYVKHRLAVAGTHHEIFSDSVVKVLYRISGGIPRIINVICDRALLGAYVQGNSVVDKKTLKQAAIEVLGADTRESLLAKAMVKLSKFEIQVSSIKFNRRVMGGVAVLALIVGARLTGLSFGIFAEENDVIDISSANTQNELPTFQGINASTPKTSRVAFDVQSADEQYAAMDELLEKEFSMLEQQLLENDDTFTKGSLSFSASDTDSIIQLWPEEYQLSRSLFDAYGVVFDRWALDYDANRHGGNPCVFAKYNGLRCLEKQGDLNDLLSLDRPAILTFYNQGGPPFYIPLVSLANGVATLSVDGVLQTVSVGTILDQWQGEYTILWRVPPTYHGAIVLGTIGPEVKWVSKKIALIQENINLEKGASYYDEVLEKKIKLFQQSEGLVVDGVVGAKTFIKLNTASGENVPQLAQGSASALSDGSILRGGR